MRPGHLLQVAVQPRICCQLSGTVTAGCALQAKVPFILDCSKCWCTFPGCMQALYHDKWRSRSIACNASCAMVLLRTVRLRASPAAVFAKSRIAGRAWTRRHGSPRRGTFHMGACRYKSHEPGWESAFPNGTQTVCSECMEHNVCQCELCTFVICPNHMDAQIRRAPTATMTMLAPEKLPKLDSPILTATYFSPSGKQATTGHLGVTTPCYQAYQGYERKYPFNVLVPYFFELVLIELEREGERSSNAHSPSGKRPVSML